MKEITEQGITEFSKDRVEAGDPFYISTLVDPLKWHYRHSADKGLHAIRLLAYINLPRDPSNGYQERQFNITADVFSKKRRRLTGRSLEMLSLMNYNKNWVRRHVDSQAARHAFGSSEGRHMIKQTLYNYGEDSDTDNDYSDSDADSNYIGDNN